MASKRKPEEQEQAGSQEQSQPEASGQTRARAVTTLTVRQRVAHIRGIMERLEWRRGVTGDDLAEQWGLSIKSIEAHASEASRQIVGDKDESARDITAGAVQLLQQALQAGDARAFKMMGDLLADISGAKAPARQEIAAALMDVNEATPSKARDMMRNLFSSQAAPGKQAAAEDEVEES